MDTKHAKAQNSNGPQKGQGPVRHAATTHDQKTIGIKRKLKKKSPIKIGLVTGHCPTKENNSTLLDLAHTTD
jgi:hypothetical protein